MPCEPLRQEQVDPLISRRARPKLPSELSSKKFFCTERLWSPGLRNAHSVVGQEFATDAEAQETCILRNRDSGYARSAMGRKSASGVAALVSPRGSNLGNGPPSTTTVETFHLVVESVGFPYDAVRELAPGIYFS